MSIAVCTAANAPYFPLLKGLVASILQAPYLRGHQLCILDLGLAPDQQDWLRANGAHLVEPGWDCDYPGRADSPAHYRAMTARPYLPKHFPGHEVYVWIDSDAWVQDDSLFPHFVAAARRGQLAIVPELDRSYWPHYRRPKLWTQNHKAFAWSFGLKAGDRLGRNPILNSGVFALAGNAPHWALWGEAHRAILNRRRLKPPFASSSFYFFIAEQTALNYVVFGLKQPVNLLPAYGNWFCGKGTPLWDAERGLLVEPNAPHTPLNVIHLAGSGQKDRVWDIKDLNGNPGFHGRLLFEEVAAQAKPEKVLA